MKKIKYLISLVTVLLCFSSSYSSEIYAKIDNIEDVREYFLDRNIHNNYVCPNMMDPEDCIDFLNTFKS